MTAAFSVPSETSKGTTLTAIPGGAFKFIDPKSLQLMTISVTDILTMTEAIKAAIPMIEEQRLKDEKAQEVENGLAKNFKKKREPKKIKLTVGGMVDYKAYGKTSTVRLVNMSHVAIKQGDPQFAPIIIKGIEGWCLLKASY